MNEKRIDPYQWSCCTDILLYSYRDGCVKSALRRIADWKVLALGNRARCGWRVSAVRTQAANFPNGFFFFSFPLLCVCVYADGDFPLGLGADSHAKHACRRLANIDCIRRLKNDPYFRFPFAFRRIIDTLRFIVTCKCPPPPPHLLILLMK